MDLTQLRSKLQSLQAKNTGGGNTGEKKQNFWKPSIGKQTIRIVPFKFNKENPFNELYFHYNIGNIKTIISPINWGEKDPIVEFSKELRKQSDKESWRMAKRLDPKMRIFVPVVVRGEEDQGVKLWGFGKELYMDFLNLAEDLDIGDYTDIVNGRDITVTTVGPEVTGTNFNKSTIMPKINQTPLSENKDLVKSILENQIHPRDAFKKYSYEEIKLALQSHLAPETEESEEEESEVNSMEIKPITGKSSNSSKFDSLFGEDN